MCCCLLGRSLLATLLQEMQTCGGSWQGDSWPWEKPALLLGQKEAMLVLRMSQKVNATAGLVSSGYFLASKPQLAGLGEATSRAAFCFSSYS